MLSHSLLVFFHPVPNTGIVLWFQQFYGMFMKRIHNFKRFYGAIVTQLILPLVFVLFSMIVAVTSPSRSSDDPVRALHVNNSALSNENLTLFIAQFGDLKLTDSDTFNFSVCDIKRFSPKCTITNNSIPHSPFPGFDCL